MTTEQKAEQYAEKITGRTSGKQEDAPAQRRFKEIEKSYLDGAKDKWVKVEDGLPEMGYKYLVFCEGYSDILIAHFAGKEWTTSDSQILEGVTHYMPLPTPPQD